MDSVKRVLIIDDDDDDCFLIEDRLSQFVNSDCEFVRCAKKEKALEFLRNQHFDLCLLDHHLGPFDGIELLDVVSGDILSTPIVMLTGQDDDEVAKLAIKKGAQDFVMKSSIDDEIFIKSIQYAISRKELEFSRFNSKKMEAENISKDKFIAHLSHELRTPLTSILGYTSLLLENDLAAPLNKELSIISNNGKHLLNLLNDVLDLSKIAAGKFELNKQSVDVETLMADINSLLSVSAVDKGLSLKFRSLNSLPKTIYTDDMRLRQILVNIIGNAIKFTDTGEINVEISFISKNEAPRINILIQDTGIGMTTEQTKQIFAPFKQLEDVTNRRAGGAGLGLSITNELIKQLQGSLRVESEPSKGTKFQIELPIEYDDQSFIDYSFDLNDRTQTIVTAPKINGTVLVVDDLFEIRQLVGYFIRQTGANVKFARNGKETLETVKQCEHDGEAIDLILLDLHMPVMTGKEAISVLQASSCQIPIVAMTAAMQKGLEEELLALGFKGVISKPVDKSTLWKQLSNYLQAKTPQVSSMTTESLVHLIEDDEDSAAIMEILLKRLGYQVIVSHDGAQAIRNVSQQAKARYFLVDLGLPDMQGEDLLEKLNQCIEDGEVIILSGNQPDQSLMAKHKVVHHMTKPVSFDMLQTMLS